MNEDKNLSELFIYEFIYLMLFSDENIINKEITINDIIIAILVLSSSLLILYNINDIFWDIFKNIGNCFDYLKINEKFKTEELLFSNSKINQKFIYILTEQGDLLVYPKKVRFDDNVIIIRY